MMDLLIARLKQERAVGVLALEDFHDRIDIEIFKSALLR